MAHLVLGLSMAATVTVAAPASARSTGPAFIPVGAQITAPRGFLQMCMTDATFCANAKKDAGQDSPPADADQAMVTGALASPASSRDREIAFAATGGIGARPSSVRHDAFPAIEAPAAQAFAAHFEADACAVRGEISPPSFLPALAQGPIGLGSYRPDQRIDLPDLFRFTSIPPSTALTKRTAPCAPVGRMAAAVPSALDASSAGQVIVVIAPDKDGRPALAKKASPAPAEQMAMLKRVNHYVNSRVRQRTDMEIHGREELWVRSGVGRGAQGDCEDIAIEKRYELIRNGFPTDQLAFGVVYSLESGLHTVLLARTEQGDVILDSRTPYIRDWSSISYSWVSVQSMNDPMVWQRVNPA
ncbi:MAG: transglutaminase-like cysteine peptidase [Sphingobium sp.]